MADYIINRPFYYDDFIRSEKQVIALCVHVTYKNP